MAPHRRLASLHSLGAPFALPTAAAHAADRGERPFPKDFLWATAISGFQAEAGGPAVNGDPNSDQRARVRLHRAGQSRAARLRRLRCAAR